MFTWNKTTEVIIYGAASYGTIVYENIHRQCNIIAFFDKRAHEITEYRGLPVYAPSTNNFSLEQKKSIVVIIAIKNVFEHISLVNILVSLGYENIIYKSTENNLICKEYDAEADQILGGLFDKVVSKSYEPISLPCNMPKILSLFHPEWKDHAIIKKDKTKVLAYVPIIQIFTNVSQGENDIWCDIPIGAMPHVEFFSYLAGNTACDPYYYLNSFVMDTAKNGGGFTLTQNWINNVFQNRAMIYEHMNLAWEIDRDFFTNNPPEATWNQKGYFNLTGGKHRCTFIASKMCKYAPILLSIEDYQVYINSAALQNCIKYFENNNIQKLFTPISHPYFYRYPCSLADVFYTVMSKLLIILGKYLYNTYKRIDFTKLRILDRSNSWRAISRCFLQMGSEVSFANQPSELDKLIDSLSLISPRPVNDKGQYDLIISDQGMKPEDYNAKYMLSISKETRKPEKYTVYKLVNYFYDDEAYSIELAGKENDCE